MEMIKSPSNESAGNFLRLLSVVFIIISLTINWVPFNIQIGKKIYNASLFDLFFSSGFSLQGNIIYISFWIKSIILISFLAGLSAVFCLISKKISCSLFLIHLMFCVPLALCYLKYFISFESDSVIFLGGFILSIDLIFIILSIFGAIFSRGIQRAWESFFQIFAFVSIAVVSTITFYVFVSGIPAIFEIGFFKFIFGTTWSPSSGLFGIWPFIVSSFAVTFGSILIGVPIGVFTAIFLSQFAPSWFASIMRTGIRLMAGIPSVVYGFLGLLIIVPLIRKMFYGFSIGDSLLAAILILSIMILPTIISISEDVLRSVPNTYKEAALALGETQVKSVIKVVLPAAKSGILSAILLGVGRAMGETMAVIMVSGNVAQMPSLLKSARFLTTGVALEMAYSSGLHRRALFSIGLTLFIFISLINFVFLYVLRNKEFKKKKF
ncbi:MAG: phosphate ABC transporter permease subunit PstC [Oscillospiraceae bacterium]|jgi:phosphate ABC transporter permease protein PstC|nr:phosphate ABC transporter permease subunit PstC [Oscillospiraceae bacterium]